MHRIASRIAIVGFSLYALGVGCHVQAQPEELFKETPKVEDNSKGEPAEQLPLPHELRFETGIVDESYLFQPPTRINRYDVWQFYAVGRQGRFRPRVAYSSGDSFYLLDGRPYPWASMHPLDFLPLTVAP